MHTKISMKNLQTFGHQNPFLRQRSLSSKSKNQAQSFTFHLTNTFKHKNDPKNIYNPIKDVTNKQQNEIPSMHGSYGSPKVKNKIPVYFEREQMKKKDYLEGQYKNYSCESIMHLLRNQEQSLERVKDVVERDKQKINKNFEEFKQTINNIIDDLKLSICCHVDEQYQQFVNNFRIVKVQYVNYCNIKKQFWQIREGQVQKTEKKTDKYAQIVSGSKILQFPGMITNNREMINNEMLVMSVIEDIKDCKRHINYKQFAQIQQKLLKPLLVTTKNMIQQMGIQSYYNPEIAYNTFKKLQASFEDNLHQMYDRMDLFMTDHKRETCRQKEDQAIMRRQVGNNSPIERIEPVFQNKIRNFQNLQYSYPNKKNVQSGHIYMTKKNSIITEIGQEIEAQSFGIGKSQNKHMQTIKEKQKYKSTSNTIANTHNTYESTQHESKATANKQEITDIMNQNKLAFNNQKNRKNKHYRQSLQANMQNHLSRNTFKLEEYRTIIDKSSYPNSGQSPEKSQTALCVISLENGGRIVVGTKSGILKIFCTKTGVKLNQLYGHTASVCSLSTLTQAGKNESQLIVSGGDIGCCQAIIWDLRENKVIHNFSHHHEAAITCFSDIQDGRHFVSGSFDCNLNIFNYKKKELTKSINTGHKITTLTSIDSKEHKYLVTGNLNSQICVWKVCRNAFNNISGLQSMRTINIGTYPYSIATLNSNSVIVTGKDNWLRVVNIWKGNVEKATQIDQCQQIMKIEDTFIGCCKNGNLSVLQAKQSEVRCQRIVGKGSVLSFSCGICPKYALEINSQKAEGSMDNFMYMPNHHNPVHTQIRVWKILKIEKLKQRNKNGNTY